MIPVAVAAYAIKKKRQAEEIILKPNDDTEMRLRLKEPKVGPDGVLVSKIKGGSVRVRPHRREVTR